jgi:hypothetical protein
MTQMHKRLHEKRNTEMFAFCGGVGNVNDDDADAAAAAAAVVAAAAAAAPRGWVVDSFPTT